MSELRGMFAWLFLRKTWLVAGGVDPHSQTVTPGHTMHSHHHS